MEIDRYAQQFGNILTQGTLHFAPDSEAVGDFLRHARATHPAMESLTVRVHEDEVSALQCAAFRAMRIRSSRLRHLLPPLTRQVSR